MDGPAVTFEAAGNNSLRGNFVGPDVSGSRSFPAPGGPMTIVDRPGALLLSSDNTVGGTTPAERNLISGNNLLGGNGVAVGDFVLSLEADRNRVQGNLIGTDRSGTQSVANRSPGVAIESGSENLVGGDDPQAANVVSGNAGLTVHTDGILLMGEATSRNTVAGNYIGTTVAGDQALPNGGHGVSLNASGNTVRGNTIAYNEDAGVSVESSTGNWITQNSIFSNQSLGIDLESLVELDRINLPQDPQDADTGANNSQNFPAILSVTADGGGTSVQGVLESRPNSNYRLEFFANEGLDFTGFGEGRTYLGFVNVTTDGEGHADFDANLPAAPGGSLYVTTTATDITDRGTGAANDTSEFSGGFPIEGCSLTVTNTLDTGIGSLRAAIQCANLLPGVDTIEFEIDGAGPHVISPPSILPTVYDPVVIDGYTQTGAVANTNPLEEGTNAQIGIRIDGTGAGNLIPGLRILAGASTVRGLSITHFDDSGILIAEHGGNLIQGNFIGATPEGIAGPNQDGVYIDTTPDNLVGGENPEDSNLLSGNEDFGVYLDGGRNGDLANDNIVRGNLVGTGISADGPVPNGGGVGLEATLNCTVQENLLAQNSFDGILVYDESFSRPAAMNNAIVRNSIFGNGGIGIELGGDGTTANDVPPASDPPDQDGGANRLLNFPELTARSDAGNTMVMGNLMSVPSTTFRIEFFSNTFTDPTGFGEGETYLGSVDVSTDADGNAAISFTASASIPEERSITATSTRLDDMGNPVETSEFSARIGGTACSTVVTNTNDSGLGSLRDAIVCANLTPGVDTISFDIPGPGPHTISLMTLLPPIVSPVVIDGYTQPGAAANTDPAGFNGALMIEISGAQLEPGVSGLTLVGGGSTVRGLVINDFEGQLDPTGELVSGGAGIEMTSVGGNAILGNFLGTDTTGAASLPNAFGTSSLFTQSGDPNRIGGTAPGDRNVISGNLYSGVLLQGNTHQGDVVQGNFVGTDKTGTAALPNGEDGVLIISGLNHKIGGDEEGAANVLSGNLFSGVLIFGNDSTSNLVQGNFIGTDSSRTLNLGNVDSGIAVFTHSVGNSFVANSIGFNGLLGIDLGDNDGVTPNDISPASDPPDQDTGANNLQNFPVLTEVVLESGMTTLSGALTSTPDTMFRIDFYASPNCDPSGSGEGLEPLGFVEVSTDAQGQAAIQAALPVQVVAGRFLTSTATRLEGGTNFADTSEFSACLQSTAGPCPEPYPDFFVDGKIDARDLIQLLEDARTGAGLRNLVGTPEIQGDDFFTFSQTWYGPPCTVEP